MVYFPYVRMLALLSFGRFQMSTYALFAKSTERNLEFAQTYSFPLFDAIHLTRSPDVDSTTERNHLRGTVTPFSILTFLKFGEYCRGIRLSP